MGSSYFTCFVSLNIVLLLYLYLFMLWCIYRKPDYKPGTASWISHRFLNFTLICNHFNIFLIGTNVVLFENHFELFNGSCIVGKQVSLGSKCRGSNSPESKCLWGASVAGEQVSREQVSGSKCRWGASVRGATVGGASVSGATVMDSFVDLWRIQHWTACYSINVIVQWVSHFLTPQWIH